MKATPPGHHGHSHSAPTLAQAEALCQRRGVRFTPMRQEVYALMLEQAAPRSAYDLLGSMQKRLDRNLAPPTVYRALEFLLEQGLIHRLESSNAYVACAHPGEAHQGIYLVCTACGQTQEIEDAELSGRLRLRAEQTGFRPQRQIVELQGRCAACAAQAR